MQFLLGFITALGVYIVIIALMLWKKRKDLKKTLKGKKTITQEELENVLKGTKKVVVDLEDTKEDKGANN
jgi:sensor domain CHASE-containing protein